MSNYLGNFVEQMISSDYHIIILNNGLRCVTRRQSGVAYCGILVGAGSRDESAWEYGLAHFVEHTLFKGTRRRRSWHIASRMESIGGELNAYTTKEETMIYTVAPGGYLPRAMELLADVVADSQFPAAELEREREVVIDEINSYLDSPMDAVCDEYEDLLYAGSGLGHNILGTPESVRTLTGEDCRSFLRRYYTPSNMVIYCVADEPASKVEALVERYFGTLHFPSTPGRSEVPRINEPFAHTRDLSLHQAHTLIGARLFSRHDSRRHAALLLNNYLGGPCMNSLLNRELREKRGYVYTVDSTIALLSDCGSLQVYFGCDREHVAPCSRIVIRLLDELTQSPMKPRIFDRIKRQYLGQLQVSAAHAEGRAMALAKSMLYYGRVHTLADTIEAVKAATSEQMLEVARMLMARPLSSLTLL